MKNKIKSIMVKCLSLILILSLVLTPNTVVLAEEVRDKIEDFSEAQERKKIKKEQLDYLEANRVQEIEESDIGESETEESNSDEETISEETLDTSVEETEVEEKEIVLNDPELPISAKRYYEELYGEPIAIYEEGRVYQTDTSSYKFIGTSEPEVYKKGDELEEIDNTLVEQRESGVPSLFKSEEDITYYTNTANDVEVNLPAKMTAERGLIFTNKEGKKFELYPHEGIYENAVVLENAILYNQVFENIDVQYTMDGQKLKEDIILRSPTEKNKFTYHFSTSQYRAVLENNTVSLFDRNAEDEKPAFYLSAPVMVDAAGEVSYEITMNLLEEGNQYILEIIADDSWLNAEERIYPVKIDPTITVPSSNLTVVTTSSMNGVYSEAAYGYVGYISQRVTGVPGGDIGKARMFFEINYNFSNLIPEDGVITSATLNTYEYSSYPSQATFACYRLTDPWNAATLSWENGVDLGREVSGENASLVASKGWKSFDIRQSVNDWIGGIAPQYGLVVMGVNELEEGAAFYTPYSGTSHQPGFNDGLKPYLEINWEISNPVDRNYPLDDTTVILRSLINANKTGKIDFEGIFTDGIATPDSNVSFLLDDASKGYLGVSPAGYSKKYPNSVAFESNFPSTTTKYRDKQGNWQTPSPFVNPDFDKVYKIVASASKDGKTGKTNSSDEFVIYKVKQYDTLPRIANYYGIPLSQMMFDNRVQDMLLIENNTLFIRNPKKNKDKPYNPPPLDDSLKEQIDSQLMGRGMHCEFGFEPVNLNTGNFYFSVEDVSIPDYNQPFSIERNYNSKGAHYISPFGRGWQFTYGEYLSRKEDGTILYTRADGSTLYFKQTEENQYESPEGYDLELTPIKIRDNTYDFGNGEETYAVYEYEIKDSEQKIRKFDCYGNLITCIDEKGNKINLQYDENFNLKEIVSESGSKYSFTMTDDGKVSSITLPNGGVLGYGYDDDNNLISYTDASGAVIKYEYDEEHRMTAWYDGTDIKIIENVYDEENRVIQQTDANGYEVYLQYHDSSTVTTDGNGYQTIYHYDEAYRTTSIVYADGTQETKTYLGNRLEKETDALGHVTSYQYDAAGNIISEIRFNGDQQRFTYDLKNNLTKEVAYDGVETQYEYDGMGNLLSITEGGYLVVSSTYDEKGRMISSTDGNGNTTTCQYTGALLTQIIDAMGNSMLLAYDSMGLLTNFTDANGNTITYTYDLEGRQRSETDGAGKTTSFTLDANGLAIGVADGNGNLSTFQYDGLGNLIGGIDSEGTTIQYEYDGNGNIVKEYDGEGISIIKSYDCRDQLISETDGEGNEVKYVYDGLGNLVEEIDRVGQSLKYTYDYTVGEIASISDGKSSISYTYSSNGKLVEKKFSDGTYETYQYDILGREIEIREVNGLMIKNEYDIAGNLLKIDKAGIITTFTYDALNRNTTVTYPNGGKDKYTYDKMGNLLREEDAYHNAKEYSYDGANQVSKIKEPNGAVTTLEYDGNGNISKLIAPNGGSTSFKYNGFNKAINMIDELGNETHYEYDKNEQVSQITSALGGTTNYIYNKNGKPTEIIDSNGNSHYMVYDKNDNYISIEAPDGGKVTYTYNESNQVVKEETSEGLITQYEYEQNGLLSRQWDNQGGNATYTYNEVGNLLSETNALGETVEYTYDMYGNITEIKEADGNITKLSYDEMLQLISMIEPDGSKTSYEYDLNGQLIKESNDSGQEILYSYDGVGNLIKEINSLGEEITYQYDQEGHLVAEIDEAGHEDKYTYDVKGQLIGQEDKNKNFYTMQYDAMGNLIQVITPQAGKLLYSYDKMGNLLSEKDMEGGMTTYAYDKMNRMKEKVLPAGGVYQYAYNTQGSLVEEIDPEGAIKKYNYDLYNQLKQKSLPGDANYTYEYDLLGRLTRQEQPEGLLTSYKYDISGNLVEEKDQSGRTVTYVYDNMHRVQEVENTLGLKTSYAYDKRGNLESIVSPMGRKTVFDYDVLDRMKKVVNPSGLVTEIKYDIVGNMEGITENGERETKFAYDNEGNLLSEVNAIGETRKYAYDNMNRLVKEEDARGSTIQYAYDKNSNVTEYQDGNGSTIKMSYDVNGNLSQIKDGNDRAISYQYDRKNRLTQVTSGADATELMKVSYQYDQRDNLIAQTDGNGNTTNYAYNKRDALISKTNPLSQTESYEYDINGRLSEVKRASGKTIGYDYNQLDMLLKESYSEDTEENVLYAYDEEGKCVTMSDITGTSSYTYDESGRISGVQSGDGNVILYNYDSYGNLSKLTYPDGGSVFYEYDGLDRLIKVIDRDGEETQYGYDKSGNMVNIVRANGTSTELTYDIANQVTMVVNKGENKKVISQYAYVYDYSGNIIEETIAQEDGTTVWNYTYNGRGELSSASAKGKENIDLSYAFDAAGNKIEIYKNEKGRKEQRIVNTYNAANQLVSSDDAAEQTAYEYDEDGNLIREIRGDESVYSYSYDTENRLRAITENGSLLQSALYDGNDNRVFVVNRKIKTREEKQSKAITTKEEQSYTWTESNESTKVNGQETSEQEDLVEETSTLKKADELETSSEKKETNESESVYQTDYFAYGFLQSMKQGYSIADSTPGQGLQIHYEKIVRWYHVSIKKDWPDEEGIVHNPSEKLSGKKDKLKFEEESKAPLKETSDEAVEDTNDDVGLDKKIRDGKKDIYKKVFIPNGVKKIDYSEYEVTNYINDTNRQYTQTLMEYNADGKVQAVYEYGNERLSYKEPKGSQYYTYDGRGNVSNLTSQTGENVLSYTYDTYGVATPSQVTSNPYDYNGEYTDSLTGNQYLRARYYSPRTGTFLTEDTFFGDIEEPLTQNRYTYTGNDPINLDDPSGHGWLSKVGKSVKSKLNSAKKTIANSKVGKKVSKITSKAKNTVSSVAKKAKIVVSGLAKNISKPVNLLKTNAKNVRNNRKVNALLNSAPKSINKANKNLVKIGNKLVSKFEKKVCTTAVRTNKQNSKTYIKKDYVSGEAMVGNPYLAEKVGELVLLILAAVGGVVVSRVNSIEGGDYSSWFDRFLGATGAASYIALAEAIKGASVANIAPKDVDINNLPEGWTRRDAETGKIFIKDGNGKVRSRYDPPKNGANGHWHDYDENGTPLDQDGNPTTPGAPNSHIYR